MQITRYVFPLKFWSRSGNIGVGVATPRFWDGVWGGGWSRVSVNSGGSRGQIRLWPHPVWL